MGRLTIEQKAEAYDNLIERLKEFQFEYRFSAFSDTIERYFPELKDSVDNLIRKKLLAFFKNTAAEADADELWNGFHYNEIIAWLEKQEHTDIIVEKAKTEKQRVIITETDGNANIDWDTCSLEDARRLLECGLRYINTELEKQRKLFYPKD